MSAADPIVEITEGMTAPLDFDLKVASATFNATGSAITAAVRDKNGREAAVTVAWLDASVSQARVTPAATSFKAALSPYTIKFRVVDGAGATDFFPQSDPEFIKVLPF